MLLVGCAGGDARAGERLYASLTIGRAGAPGCITCHSPEPGEIKVGPSHSGVASRAAEVIRQPGYTGSAASAKEYLRESILDPNAYIASGFDPGVMYPDYSSTLTDGQLEDLVAFLLTLE